MKYKGQVKKEDIQDLNNQYSIDVEDQLANILAEEIDREILTNVLVEGVDDIFKTLKRDHQIDILIKGVDPLTDKQIIENICKDKYGKSFDQDLIDRIYQRYLDN
jgi:hypothetical protein